MKRAEVKVVVVGVPATPNTFISYGSKAHRVVQVTGTYIFHDGMWDKPSWKASGRLVKKDGDLGASWVNAPYGFSPDAETQAQFMRSARKLLRASNGVDPSGLDS